MTEAVDNPERHDGSLGAEERSVWFWPLGTVGWGVMAFAIWGIFHQHRQTNPWGLARLVIGLDLVHDLVLAPLVLGIGVVLTRWLPVRLRVPAKVGLIVSGAVLLYTYPFLLGRGRSATAGSSRLPNNYAFGVWVVLGTVWAVIVAGTLLRWSTSRRR